MLGRPIKMLPVFISQMLPTCVSPSAQQERMTAMSSTYLAISGYQSLTQMPDWPCCLNLRWLAISGVPAVLPIAVCGRGKLAGSGLPASLLSAGLGSKRSRWLGPPSRKHQMTDFALHGRGGALAASGFLIGSTAPLGGAAGGLGFATPLRKDPHAGGPKTPPARKKKTRREIAQSW